MSSFEEDFPSLLTGKHFLLHPNQDEWVITEKAVIEYCLDKQKVREAWNILMDKTDDLHVLVCGKYDDAVEEFIKKVGL